MIVIYMESFTEISCPFCNKSTKAKRAWKYLHYIINDMRWYMRILHLILLLGTYGFWAGILIAIGIIEGKVNVCFSCDKLVDDKFII